MADTLRRRDVDFLLFDAFGIESLLGEPHFAHVGRAELDGVLDTAFRIARERFEPIAAMLDAQEPAFVDGGVRLPAALKGALQDYARAGFIAAGVDVADGGLGLPYSVALAAQAAFTAANNPAAGYAFLTSAAANLLLAHGSAAQKARYLRPMLEGRFFGTMVLSEPATGSSLGDITTEATPVDHGRYAIRGTKTWISGGDHDLAENIVHFVLARVRGAAAGTRGLSLFIVPKFRVGDDGSVGAANDVTLAGLNHKLGHRGTTNCVLAFGDAGACEGELMGAAGGGLPAMFHMMNEARIGVGTGAAVTAYAAYLHALDYARTRLQGRSAMNRDPQTPQLPLIAHPDVRRMLLAQKVVAEGGLALCLYCASLVDRQKGGDQAAAREAGLLLELLTPIAKSWPSEEGIRANSLAIQVLGGAGYCRDHPVERLFRDQRLNAIHEGTTGIQAIDLLGRKLGMHGGAAIALLAGEIAATCAAAARSVFDREAAGLARMLADWRATSDRLIVTLADDPEAALANATLYLDVTGALVIGWTWLRVALAADRLPDTPFARGKAAACRYFFRYDLPRARALMPLLDAIDRTCLDADPGIF